MTWLAVFQKQQNSSPHERTPLCQHRRFSANIARSFSDACLGIFRLPLGNGEVDIAYLWGVFTNMTPEDVLIYIQELNRILKPGGRVFLTAFVEMDAPEISFNPPGYGSYEYDGSPLFVVRYRHEYLCSAFRRHGLKLDELRHHGGGTPYQSEIYLTKA